MKCNIQFTHVSIGGYTGCGEAKAVGRCLTHNFPMPDVYLTTNEMCPIGKIEEATDLALERIREKREREDT